MTKPLPVPAKGRILEMYDIVMDLPVDFDDFAEPNSPYHRIHPVLRSLFSLEEWLTEEWLTRYLQEEALPDD